MPESPPTRHRARPKAVDAFGPNATPPPTGRRRAARRPAPAAPPVTACRHCRAAIVTRPSRLREGEQVWTLAGPTTSIPSVCWPRGGSDLSHQPAPPPLTDEQIEAAVAEALREVEVGVADTRGDRQVDVDRGLLEPLSDDDLYHAVASSVLSFYPPAVRATVRRRLGFDADGY
jgi:hypothetical protein